MQVVSDISGFETSALLGDLRVVVVAMLVMMMVVSGEGRHRYAHEQ